MSSPYQPVQGFDPADLEPTANHPIVGQYAQDLAGALQRAASLGVPITLGSEAASRFTKTPIQILDINKVNQTFRDILGIPGTEQPLQTATKPTTGTYGDNQIRLQTYGQPTYSDVAGAIHHEDIHALLEKAGYKYPVPQVSDWTNFMYGNPVDKAENAFYAGNRGGTEARELPAYVGAYNPTQLPGFSEADRQRYLNALYPTMQPSVAQTLQRMVQSYNASQNPPFAAAPAPPLRSQLRQQATQSYSTSVPASRSAEYQQWIQNLNRKRGGDASGDTADYDLTGAFLGGVQPDARGHLPDTFKKPNHMTFSTDSKYSTPAEPGGTWQDAGNGRWIFYASPTNLKYHSPAELTDYFNKYEPDSQLVLPPKTPVPSGLKGGRP